MNNKTNIEDIHTIIQIRNIFEHLKKYGWANDITKEIDPQKAVQAIENILADREIILEENKKNKDALEILNKMKKKYKIALFMIIRNSMVMPKGIKLGKSEKEINKMTYETLCEVLTMINFKTAEKMYEEGKSSEHI